MKISFTLTLVISLSVLALPIAQAELFPTPQARLINRLIHFPKHSTPYSRLKPVVVALAKANLYGIPSYFRIAASRLKNKNNKIKLYEELLMIIQHSGLPLDDQESIGRALTSIFTGGNSGSWG